MTDSNNEEACLTIREIKLSDINKVAEIHFESLSNDFFPALGIKFLRDYYKLSVQLQAVNQLKVLGAFIGDNLVGFCQVVFNSISLFKLFKPSILPRLFILILFRPLLFLNGVVQLINSVRLNAGCAEIAFIAVAPAYQRIGIGSKLIVMSIKESRGNKMNWLITKTANKNLSLFYQRVYNAEIIKRFSALERNYEILKWAVV